MPFEKLNNLIGERESLVFLDLEATQFSHHAIAIGLLAYKTEKTGFLPLDNRIDEFSSLIKIKKRDRIGTFVKKITGLNEDNLQDNGKDFHAVLQEVANVLRPYRNKKFLCFGNYDMKILRHSINFDDEFEKTFFRHVMHNSIDLYTEYFSHFLVDKHGQGESIEKIIDFYKIPKPDNLHDPLADAKCLKEIFLRFVQDEEKTIKEILPLSKNSKFVLSQMDNRQKETGQSFTFEDILRELL